MGATTASSVLDLEKNCTGACQCTHWMTWLAVDASHVYLLKRIALQLSEDVQSAVDRLIDCHTCDGDRALLSTAVCFRKEIEEKPDLLDQLSAEKIRAWFTLVDDGGFNVLPDPSQPSQRKFEEGDRRLAAGASGQGDKTGMGVWLVTDDEDFLENLVENVDVLSVVPIHSCDLILALASCGALDSEVVEAMVEVEGERISLMIMGPSKKARKLDRLADVASRLVAIDWGRNGG